MLYATLLMVTGIGQFGNFKDQKKNKNKIKKLKLGPKNQSHCPATRSPTVLEKKLSSWTLKRMSKDQKGKKIPVSLHLGKIAWCA